MFSEYKPLYVTFLNLLKQTSFYLQEKSNSVTDSKSRGKHRGAVSTAKHTLQTLCLKAQPKHGLCTQVCARVRERRRGQRVISTLLTEAQCQCVVGLPDIWPLWKHADRLRVVRLATWLWLATHKNSETPLYSFTLLKGETQFRQS